MSSTRSAIALLSAVVLAGCFTPDPPSQSDDTGVVDDSNNIETDAGETSNDAAATDGGTSRDMSVSMGECESDGDCTAPDGATAVCEDGECTVSCATDRVDLDGDLSDGAAGTGCECEVLSSSDDTCDGVDDDCSGVADDAAPTMDCSNQDGICSGTSTACLEGAYAACDDAFFEASLPDWKADELYVCDGLDNDCDANDDEGCCAAGTTPTDNILGDGLWADAAPAIAGAPAGASFLVVYKVTGTEDIRLQHVDAAGTPVGPEVTETVPGDSITGVQIASSPNHYYVAVRSNDFDLNEEILVARFDSGLTKLDDWPGVDPSDDGVGNPRIASGPTHVCVVWSDRTDQTVEMSCYQHGAPPSSPSPGQIASNFTGMFSSDYDITSVGDRFAVAYASSTRVNTLVFASDGSGQTAGPATTGTDIGDPRLAAEGDQVVVVWNDEDTLWARDFQSDGTQGQGPQSIVGNVHVFAIGLANGLLTIAYGETLVPEFAIGSVPAASLGPISNPTDWTFNQNTLGGIELAKGPNWYGLAMIMGDPQFHPISFEGIPGCP